MKTLRTFSLCMFMALILLVVPSIFAQDETFGLSDADFDFFTTANATTGEADSLTYNFTASFSTAGTGSDVSADLSGSGVIGGDDDNPLFEFVVTGQVVSDGDTTPVDLQIRLVGDTIYVNDGTGWVGQPADELFSEFGAMAGGMTGMSVDPDEIASGDLSALSGMEGMAEAMSALSSLNPSEFIGMSRSDSGGLAVFTTSISISDLLSSPSLAPLFMMGMSGGASMEGMEMDEQQMAAMAGMFAAMFSEATVTFVEYIDPASNLVQRAVLDINLPVPDMAGSGQSINIALNFDINLSGYGEPVTLEAPADAVMSPGN